MKFLRHERKKRLIRWRLTGWVSSSETYNVQLKPEEGREKNEDKGTHQSSTTRPHSRDNGNTWKDHTRFNKYSIFSLFLRSSIVFFFRGAGIVFILDAY